jgi:hypothetical protein
MGILLMGGITGIFGSIHTGFAADPLIIGSPVPENSPDGLFQKLLISEIYRRVGVKATIKYYPMKRCSYLANRGDIDGETERVYNYNTMFPNLIRVESSTRAFTFAVYAGKPLHLAGEGWGMLKDTPYNVEYQRGVKKAQEKLTELVPSGNLSETNLVEHGIKKLITGRTDLFVTFEHWIKTGLHTEEFRGHSIHQVGILEEAPLYTYLHKKHRELAPKAAEVLKQMKADGILETYLHHAYHHCN